VKILNPDISLELFWKGLDNSKNSILMLDYDGTLAPFRKNRKKAVPYEGVRSRLTALVNLPRTRLVIISGRDIKSLKLLLKLKIYPEIWGSHGAERLNSEGNYKLLAKKKHMDGLNEINKWIDKNEFSKYTEFKPVSCAFHWRGLSDKEARDIKSIVQKYWGPIIDRFGLQLHFFDGGIEIRPVNNNKGTAVKIIINNIESGTVAAYLGDDETDEDAFGALRKLGLKVLVREEAKQTSADIQITPPGELIKFLDRWINSVS